jgi:hypothetical protein
MHIIQQKVETLKTFCITYKLFVTRNLFSVKEPLRKVHFLILKMAKEREICPVCVSAIGNKLATVPVVRKSDNQGPSGENLLTLTFF